MKIIFLAALFAGLSGIASAQVPPPPMGSTTALSAPELVKLYRNSLIFVDAGGGAGSGFLAALGKGNYLFTNAHVAAGAKNAGFRTLEGEKLQTGAASVAVGHDIFLLQTNARGRPLEIMQHVDEHASIGDEIVVLGNAEGAGVINTITGKLVGLGPNLVEVDAPFQPGNSGSPIIHLQSGKVIGVATYLTVRKYDTATKEPIKDPVVRRFGYRLDSVKTWQPVSWPAFFAQADELKAIERLTEDLITFLEDLARDAKVTRDRHTNPAIKNRIDAWLTAKARRLSPADAQSVDQNFIAFLKVTSQADVTAARQRLTYDYFQRALAEQQKERAQIAEIFSQIIKEMRNAR